MIHHTFHIFFFLCFFSLGRDSTAETNLPPKYTELLDYIVRSPNQAHTDNCLYMAATGAVEILMNKHFKMKNPGINGDYDFNEKTALRSELSKEVSWLEDPILRFNSGALLNADLPYRGRTFWGGAYPKRKLVELPKVKTLWFLKTDEGSKEGRFSYDEFKDSDLKKIKEMLIKYLSPVVVIYRTAGRDRSYGYWNTWHAAVIVGFNDDLLLEEKCPILEETLEHIGSTAKKELKAALKREGGCRSHGGFYVRDSEDPEPGEVRAPSYVIKSYDDIKFLGTQAMVVYLPQDQE